MAVACEHVGSFAVARQGSNSIARKCAGVGHKSNRVYARSSIDARNRCRGAGTATCASGSGRSFLGCYGGGAWTYPGDCRLPLVRSGNHSYVGKPLSGWNAYECVESTSLRQPESQDSRRLTKFLPRRPIRRSIFLFCFSPFPAQSGPAPDEGALGRTPAL